jgi:hypothetical protein
LAYGIGKEITRAKAQSTPRTKPETRNAKTNPNDRKAENSKHAHFGFRFLDFGFEVFRFVSDFELRISGFAWGLFGVPSAFAQDGLGAGKLC